MAQTINRALAYCLLTGATFHESRSIMLPGGKPVLFIDIVAMVGLQVRVEAAEPGGCTYSIQAGYWIREGLLSSTESNVFFKRIFGQLGDDGLLKRQAFELMLIEQMCIRTGHHALTHADGLTLGELLPCLATSLLGTARIQHALRLVKLPKATKTVNTRLSPNEKAVLCTSRDTWKGNSEVHPSDYAWILSHWLSDGYIGVPQESESECHNFILRLQGGVVAFALKANSERNVMCFSDVLREIALSPPMAHFAVCEPPLVYVLAFVCLYLGPTTKALCESLKNATNGGNLMIPSTACPAHAESKAPKNGAGVFQLVICNPDAFIPASSLLGPERAAELQQAANRGADIAEVGMFLADTAADSAPQIRI
jgi:hypothetical protein